MSEKNFKIYAVVLLLVCLSIVIVSFIYFRTNSTLLEIENTTYTVEDFRDNATLRGAIEEKAYSYAWQKYFADKLKNIDESEVEKEFSTLKSQMDNESWEQYLSANFNGSEDALREAITFSVAQENAIKEYEKDIEVSEDEVKKEYATNPSNYDFLLVDTIFIKTTEDYEKVKEMINNNLTLTEIADSIKTEISVDEKLPLNSTMTFNKDISTVQVGDLLYSDIDSNLVAISIKEIHNSYDEAIFNSVYDSLLYSRAYEKLEKDYTEYLNNLSVSILGETVQLGNM